jgi:hypothetical protein
MGTNPARQTYAVVMMAVEALALYLMIKSIEYATDQERWTSQPGMRTGSQSGFDPHHF